MSALPATEATSCRAAEGGAGGAFCSRSGGCRDLEDLAGHFDQRAVGLAIDGAIATLRRKIGEPCEDTTRLPSLNDMISVSRATPPIDGYSRKEEDSH